MVFTKIKYVMMPIAKDDQCKQLRNWDLWGPLFVCLIMSLTFAMNSKQGAAYSGDRVFAMMFSVLCLGSLLITVNSKMLGAKISIFQSICVIGYCIFPICISTLICVNLKASLPLFLRLLIGAAAFGWSTMASSAFIKSIVEEKKQLLAIYPCGLFYFFLAFISALGG